MSENVVSLKGGSIENDRRKAFMASVAASFDRYVTDHGQEHDAIVYTMCGLQQPSQIGWDVQGASTGGVTSVIALAAVHMLTEAGQTRQGVA